MRGPPWELRLQTSCRRGTSNARLDLKSAADFFAYIAKQWSHHAVLDYPKLTSAV